MDRKIPLVHNNSSYAMRVSEGLKVQWFAQGALPTDKDAPRAPTLAVGERCALFLERYKKMKHRTIITDYM